MANNPPPTQQGFTLIELVIGMVILAIAMTVISSMLAPLAKTAMSPVRQMRAAELGSTLMQEILSKSFDENSDHNGGGLWRCGDTEEEGDDTGVSDCTDAGDYGPDSDSGETTPTLYNDVDDYDTCSIVNDANTCIFKDITYLIDDEGLTNVIDDDEDPAQLYNNFRYKVEVTSSSYTEVKQIDLTIRTSSNEDIHFSAYRWNY